VKIDYSQNYSRDGLFDCVRPGSLAFAEVHVRPPAYDQSEPRTAWNRAVVSVRGGRRLKSNGH
jgi:hypothetical protein